MYHHKISLIQNIYAYNDAAYKNSLAFAIFFSQLSHIDWRWLFSCVNVFILQPTIVRTHTQTLTHSYIIISVIVSLSVTDFHSQNTRAHSAIEFDSAEAWKNSGADRKFTSNITNVFLTVVSAEWTARYTMRTQANMCKIRTQRIVFFFLLSIPN